MEHPSAMPSKTNSDKGWSSTKSLLWGVEVLEAPESTTKVNQSCPEAVAWRILPAVCSQTPGLVASVCCYDSILPMKQAGCRERVPTGCQMTTSEFKKLGKSTSFVAVRNFSCSISGTDSVGLETLSQCTPTNQQHLHGGTGCSLWNQVSTGWIMHGGLLLRGQQVHDGLVQWRQRSVRQDYPPS